jgi:glycolate dehydrogenase FAD-linked subunit
MRAAPPTTALTELSDLLGPDGVRTHGLSEYANDATEQAGLRAMPDAVALPAGTEQVRATVEWASRHGIALVPRGGGTGFAGGAVAVEGGVIVDLTRMNRILSFKPELWQIHVEAGVLTGTLQRVARESGLRFPPDPGAAERSQIGGNIATNAGGPHAFKYGVTGRWVTGLEAVVPPGDVVSFGGPIRKDVAAYNLGQLLVGSEGTLGIITAAWLRLIPAPEVELPVVASYPSAAQGCEAILRVLASGCVPAAIEFLDAGALAAARGSFPAVLGAGASFLVITEADGTELEAGAAALELREALTPDALDLWSPTESRDVRALWRWREGLSLAVAAQRGGKLSEDIVVPPDRLHDAVKGTVQIGHDHGLPACSWGHAGDGNLHSAFMLDISAEAEVLRARSASRELYRLALELGGSVSGEHGIGWCKRGQLELQLGVRELELHRAVKLLFDPDGIMNPGKKI